MYIKKFILILMLAAISMPVFSQQDEKIRVWSVRTDTLIVQLMNENAATDTCVVMSEDTIYWRLCSSIVMDSAYYADTAGFSYYADSSGVSGFSDSSGVSVYSDSSYVSYYSDTSGVSGYADSTYLSYHSWVSDSSIVSSYADSAHVSYHADVSDSSVVSAYSDSSYVSYFSDTSGVSAYADSAYVSWHSDTSGVSWYSDTSGVSGHSSTSDLADSATVAVFADSAATAGTATLADSATNCVHCDSSDVSATSWLADSSVVTNYAWLIDSTHCYGYLSLDSIAPCDSGIHIGGDLYVDTLHYTGLDPAPGGGSSLWDTTTASANLALHPSDTTWDVSVGTDRMGGTELFRVRDGAVLFDGATGSTPVSGAGTRLMWIPASGTFAAGVVNSTQFDAIGDHSVVFGENNTATGTHNIIAGGGCTATNNYSAIFGDRCVEIYGGYVLLFGSQNEARNYSLCGGYGNSTNSTSSILIGHNLIDYGVGMGNAIFGYGGGSTSGTSILFSGFANINYADYSFTTGQHIINRSYNASVMGRYNIDAGTSNSWVSTDPLFQVGNGTGVQGTGQYNDAFRLNKDASGWFKRDSATAPIIVWTTADSTVTINTDLIVEDTLTVGDSSYIYESADTLYIQSEKPIKVGDDCLIVAENGDVTCTKDLYAKFPYGYYSDTTDQADGGANAIPVKFNVTEDEYGMTMSDDTLVTFSIAGKYLITFSVIIKPGSAGKTFQIFPCKNDVPVTRSNTIWESIGTADRIVTVTYIIEFAATDTFHLCWYTNDASAILDYTAAASSPPRPQCPSIIMTINKISN
jgi:hypothetical protein